MHSNFRVISGRFSDKSCWIFLHFFSPLLTATLPKGFMVDAFSFFTHTNRHQSEKKNLEYAKTLKLTWTKRKNLLIDWPQIDYGDIVWQLKCVCVWRLSPSLSPFPSFSASKMCVCVCVFRLVPDAELTKAFSLLWVRLIIILMASQSDANSSNGKARAGGGWEARWGSLREEREERWKYTKLDLHLFAWGGGIFLFCVRECVWFLWVYLSGFISLQSKLFTSVP